MEPSTATLVGGLTSLLPWSIKPLYGLMTDAVPICGYRRKPYTIIGGAVMTLCWFGMALCTTELWHAIIFLTLGNVAAAAVNVCAEAVTVECSNDRSFGRAATLQSWQWGSNMLASIIGSIIGGYALDSIGQKPLFLATGCVAIIQIPAAFLADEEAYQSEQGYKAIVKEWWAALQACINHQMTLHVLIFVFILFSTPTNGDASSYFYTNELKMSANVLATVGILGQA